MNVIGLYLAALYGLSDGQVSADSFLLAFIYFILGLTLKPLSNHKKNYLSVSSSFIVSFLLISYRLVSHGDLWALTVFSFGWGSVLIIQRLSTLGVWSLIGLYMLALLPSVLMWVGLTYKSSRQVKETSVREVAMESEPVEVLADTEVSPKETGNDIAKCEAENDVHNESLQK
jgi:hypothetical protein